MQVRALVNVALDLADDLTVTCAVAVVDGGGGLRGVERPAEVAPEELERAILTARRLIADGGREHEGHGVGAVLLDAGGQVGGALAVSGGPAGFAIEACRVAARALGLEPGAGPAVVTG